MSGYLTPMLLVTCISAGNEVYNHNGNLLDAVKPLVAGGLATGFCALASNIPNAEPVVTGIAWLAFVALMISPIQNPSPAQNLLKITGGLNG